MTAPFKWGSEFLVNKTTSEGYEPAVTALANGRFVVTWMDSSPTGGDTSGSAIRARVFNADGTAFGHAFLVNSTLADNQGEPAITTLADGRFVVCWVDNSATGGDTSESAVRARVFYANGTPSGAEFLVNTTTTSQQFDPAITALDGGGFVVSWSDMSATGGDASFNAVRAQVFSANGVPSGGEFVVNSTTSDNQFEPAITALADGRFVVCWSDASTTFNATSLYSFRAQVFNSDGTPSGDEFLVGRTEIDFQYQPAITALADGRFVISWSEWNPTGGDTTPPAVHAQIFDPRETAVTLAGTQGSDSFVGTVFADTIAGAAGHDTLFGARGKDRLDGSRGNDRLLGGLDNDRILGGGGADILNGGAGSDRLRGGNGKDRLIGGGDADTFVFVAAAEAGTGANRDRISDFAAGSDKLDLSAFMAGGAFIGSAAFTPGNGPQVRFSLATGILSGDVTGDGITDFQIELDGAPVLTAADFLF